MPCDAPKTATLSGFAQYRNTLARICFIDFRIELMMKTLSAAAGMFAAVLLLSNGSNAQESSQTVTSEEYQDWLVQCVEGPAATRCRMHQSLTREGTGQEFMRLTVLATPTDEGLRNVMQIRTPLGVGLRAGIAIIVGEQAVQNIPYDRCDGAGCYASFFLNDELLALFRGSVDGTVRLMNGGTREPFGVGISFRGFTSGLSAVAQGSSG